MNTTQEAVNQPVNTLPAFNQTISIEIEVQTIYEKLMSEFPNDYKHRELLAHAIIGSAVSNGGLNFIYNALNGYPNDINFQVGDIVVCTTNERYERYDSVIENSDGTMKNEPIMLEDGRQKPHKPSWNTRCVEIGQCEVIGVDMYRKDKLFVRFNSYSHYSGNSEIKVREEWVSHHKCTKVPAI